MFFSSLCLCYYDYDIFSGSSHRLIFSCSTLVSTKLLGKTLWAKKAIFMLCISQ